MSSTGTEGDSDEGLVNVTLVRQSRVLLLVLLTRSRRPVRVPLQPESFTGEPLRLSTVTGSMEHDTLVPVDPEHELNTRLALPAVPY